MKSRGIDMKSGMNTSMISTYDGYDIVSVSAVRNSWMVQNYEIDLNENYVS